MRILVTGGAGFIGSHLCAALAADGHPLVVLDDLSSGKREYLAKDITLIEGDIAKAGVFDAVVKDVDAVFHLAAIASVERSYYEWLRTHEVNIGGMVNLFDAIARSKRPIPVVYASSAATYGNGNGSVFKEDGRMEPTSAYGADKLSCELQGRVAERNHGIPNIGLRFFNVYGPRQDPASPYSGVISIFAGRLIKNQPIEIHGDGQQSRDFIYVDDIVRGLRLAMDKLTSGATRFGVFNLCTGRATSVAALADIIGTAAGTKAQIKHGPVRPGDARHAIGDPALAGSGLGFKAQVPIEEGLAKLLAWLRQNS